jgi:hypothetical protein
VRVSCQVALITFYMLYPTPIPNQHNKASDSDVSSKYVGHKRNLGEGGGANTSTFFLPKGFFSCGYRCSQ